MRQRIQRSAGFLSVYLAGKISKNDWRHDLFPALRSAGNPANLSRGGINQDTFTYTGPFFVSCDHGCAHGESKHGQGISGISCGNDLGVTRFNTQRTVSNSCLREIGCATFVFCWLEDPTAFGTLFELGYATAIGKQVFIAVKRPDSKFTPSQHFWFSLAQASKWIEVDSHHEGWLSFKDWARKRRKESILRSAPKAMTSSQRDYILGLLERFPEVEIIHPETFDQVSIGFAGAIIDCLKYGGDPTEAFEDLFRKRSISDSSIDPAFTSQTSTEPPDSK